MRREVIIGVTPYVRKYIAKTYGPSEKFDLTSSPRNDLRISLINLDYTASVPILPSRRASGCNIIFDLGTDQNLISTYEKSKRWLKVRSYFEYEFNLMLKNYLAAQAELAEKLGLSQSQYNARIGLETFLEKYEIEDYEYSYESLRRQWNRLRQKDYTYFYAFLTGKLGFRPPENQEFTNYFSPARLQGKQRMRITFHCYSRKHEDIIEKELYVPQKTIRSGDWVEWTDIAIHLINNLLRQGYTIK